MRKNLILAVLLALVAPAVWLGSSGKDGGGDNGLGFGKQIAGGWLATLDLGAPPTVDVLINLVSDGNVIVSGQLRWAGPDNTGGWNGTRFNTTGHGSWSRISPNRIKVLLLLQVQDNDGVVVYNEKVGMLLNLNRDGTRMEGTGQYQLIEAQYDPLDPEQVYASGPFTATLRVIR